MDTARAARRELMLVVALAASGIALAAVAALVPWYEPTLARPGGAAVVQTYSPVPADATAAQAG